ncbi:MAG: PepSY domain-containing protein [Cellulomonadaceae bacterium]|nr:PepSY domain-containing protein [Cellulomonadaceae bacterium]
MTTPVLPPLAETYLADLDRALANADPRERAETVAAIRERIVDELSQAGGSPDDDAVSAILGRLGSVDTIAATASPASEADAPEAAGTRGGMTSAGVADATAASAPRSKVGWLVGAGALVVAALALFLWSPWSSDTGDVNNGTAVVASPEASPAGGESQPEETQAGDAQTEGNQAQDAESTEGAGTVPAGTDPAAAAALAAIAAGDGEVISIDPENGDVWSVLVRTSDGNGVERYVNAATGEIVRERPEPLPAEAVAGTPAVSANKAIDIVLEARPGAVVRELDLGTDRGTVVWEILVQDSTPTEFYVDATTGTILKEEVAD